MKKRIKLMMGLLLVGAVFSAKADLITLTAAADTYLFENTGVAASVDRNYGAATLVAVRNDGALTQHTLLRFDLSGLETNIIINSVTLRMQKINVYSGSNVDLHVYELSAANTNWVEGSKIGVAETGSASWVQKAYAQTGWAGSAGASTAGTDYLTDVLAKDSTFTAGVKDFTSMTAFATSVSNHLGGALNLLLMLDPGSALDGRAFEYASKENTGGYVVPTLIVDYTVIPEPMTLGLLGLGGVLVSIARQMRR